MGAHLLNTRLAGTKILTNSVKGFLLFQAIAIASSRKSVRAYNLGLWSFLCSVVTAVILLVQDAEVAEVLLRTSPLLFALRVVELVAVVGLIFASLAIPRRPDVFHDGRLVDRMFTVAAFSRFQFSWPKDVLSLAYKKKNLDMVDLPRPNHYTRSKEVSDDWKRRAYTGRLWVSVMRAHADKFALQWLLTLGTAVLNFAPQWVILRLLIILETRVPGQTYGLDVWIWVIYLGIVIISQAVSLRQSLPKLRGKARPASAVSLCASMADSLFLSRARAVA